MNPITSRATGITYFLEEEALPPTPVVDHLKQAYKELLHQLCDDLIAGRVTAKGAAAKIKEILDAHDKAMKLGESHDENMILTRALLVEEQRRRPLCVYGGPDIADPGVFSRECFGRSA